MTNIIDLYYKYSLLLLKKTDEGLQPNTGFDIQLNLNNCAAKVINKKTPNKRISVNKV